MRLADSEIKPATDRSAKVRRMRGVLALFAALGGATFGLPSVAPAAFTTIKNPPADESKQAGVMDHIYGGNFTLEANGVDITNGTVTAHRVDDTGTTSDQLWNSQNITATIEASFFDNMPQEFGYFDGASGALNSSTFHSLMSTNAFGYNVSGTATVANAGGSTFRWGSQNPLGYLSSVPTDNLGSADHIVTYQIDGLTDGLATDLLFIDDYGNGYKSLYNPDFDFQDMIIQLQAKTLTPVDPPITTSVPEPASVCMVIAGAGLLLAKRSRRKSPEA